MSDWYDEARKYIKTKVTSSDNSFGGLMAAWFKAGAPSGSTGSVPAATTTVVGGVKMAADQANSVAADVATVVTDFNALLAKLKAAGIMA